MFLSVGVVGLSHSAVVSLKSLKTFTVFCDTDKVLCDHTTHFQRECPGVPVNQSKCPVIYFDFLSSYLQVKLRLIYLNKALCPKKNAVYREFSYLKEIDNSIFLFRLFLVIF